MASWSPWLDSQEPGLSAMLIHSSKEKESKKEHRISCYTFSATTTHGHTHNTLLPSRFPVSILYASCSYLFFTIIAEPYSTSLVMAI